MPGHFSYLHGLGAGIDLSSASDRTNQCPPDAGKSKDSGRKADLEGRNGRMPMQSLAPPSHFSKNAVMEQNKRKTMSFTKGGRGQPSDQFQ